MKLIALVNLALALGLMLVFGLSGSLGVVLNFVSPVLHAGLLGGISRLPVTGAVRELFYDAIGWPAWSFPTALALLAGLVIMGRFESRG